MRAAFIALAALLLAARPVAADAHPLGNFTINHEADIVVHRDGLTIDYALDLAEIPTFQLRDSLASDPPASCAALTRQLSVTFDARPLALAVTQARVAFAAGQGGLETLRLDCAVRAPWPGWSDQTHELAVRDTSYAERIGWREMTARGDGVAIDTTLPAESASARLTAYPKDALASAPDVRVATLRLSFDSAASTAQRQRVATPIGPSTDVLTSLLDRTDLGALGLLGALLFAFALGALHAATPGHGKTVMAAYLVGTRRSARQAIALGLTVAISHTAGVVCLALIVVFGAWALSPERVYPVVSAVSAAVVLGLGVLMSRRELAHRRAHRHGHDHSHNVVTSGGWRSLVALGLAGGLVPSASALVLLLGAIAARQAELGIVLVLAFGVGMAATLVGVGVALVAVTRIASRSGVVPGRILAHAPAIAAVVVLIVGLGLTAQSLVALL